VIFRSVLVALLLLAVAGAAFAALPARLTLDGVGGVTPGMREAAVERRWGLELELSTAFGSQCAPAIVSVGSMRGHAIFLNARFGALFLRRGAVTGKGIRIGSTLAELKRAYGTALSSRANKYTPGARDFFVRRARKPRWQLRFDVSPRGRIVQIAFGNDAVRLVEGCA